MQTPAPFGYERATSVDHAIQLLEQLGPEARLVAGGHSFIPMMKLRLAQPEHVIDINPLYAELGSISIESNQLVIGAMARHNDLLDSAIVGEHFPVLARRRACDRRPGRPQSRHDRRFAVPGRPGRGPVGGAVGAQGRGRDPRLGRQPHCAGARAAHRAVRDGRRGRRDPHPHPHPDPQRMRQRLREGRTPRPATGRSPPSPPSCGWRATRSPTPASDCARSAPSTSCRPRRKRR